MQIIHLHYRITPKPAKSNAHGTLPPNLGAANPLGSLFWTKACGFMRYGSINTNLHEHGDLWFRQHGFYIMAQTCIFGSWQHVSMSGMH